MSSIDVTSIRSHGSSLINERLSNWLLRMQTNKIKGSMHIYNERVKHTGSKCLVSWGGVMESSLMSFVVLCGSKKLWILCTITACRLVSWIFRQCKKEIMAANKSSLFMCHSFYLSGFFSWNYKPSCMLSLWKKCVRCARSSVSHWQSFLVLNAWLKPCVMCAEMPFSASQGWRDWWMCDKAFSVIVFKTFSLHSFAPFSKSWAKLSGATVLVMDLWRQTGIWLQLPILRICLMKTASLPGGRICCVYSLRLYFHKLMPPSSLLIFHLDAIFHALYLGCTAF